MVATALGEFGRYFEYRIKEADVNILWNLRYHLSTPRRKKFSKILFDSLYPVVENLLSGKIYSHQEIVGTEYFQRYLRRLHPGKGKREMTKRIENHCVKHFLETENLLWDIEQYGLSDPIDFVDAINGKRYMLRGYRRLVIAKALGIKEIKVKIIPEIGKIAFLESGGYIG